jgi:hypothetical protein
MRWGGTSGAGSAQGQGGDAAKDFHQKLKEIGVIASAFTREPGNKQWGGSSKLYSTEATRMGATVAEDLEGAIPAIW